MGMVKALMDNGADMPTPSRVDILAEVSERLNEEPDYGIAFQPIRNLAFLAGRTVYEMLAAKHREHLVNLAAHCIARIERIDNEEILLD